MRVFVLHESEARELIKEAVREGVRNALSEWEFLNVPGNGTTVNLRDRKAAATFLGCSISTIDLLKRTGEIPAYRVGGAVRFKEADLLEYLDRQRIEYD